MLRPSYGGLDGLSKFAGTDTLTISDDFINHYTALSAHQTQQARLTSYRAVTSRLSLIIDLKPLNKGTSYVCIA